MQLQGKSRKKANQSPRRRINALLQLATLIERANSSYEFSTSYDVFENVAYIYIKGERSNVTVTADYSQKNSEIIDAILKGIERTRKPDDFTQIVLNALTEANQRYPHLRSYHYDLASKLLSA